MWEDESLLTESAPNTTAEFQSQVTFFLQELRTDFAQWDPLDADILGAGIA
jgi:hypothetical protein